MYQPHHRPDPDPDDQAAGDLDPWNTEELEDHPDDDPELGTPVYEGTGLSVRALTAEEVDRFLDAHAGQPAQLLGSGWDTLQPSAPQPTEGPLRGAPEPLGPATTGWPTPPPTAPRLAPRGGYGSPGRSALQTYRQQRAAELAGWARTAGWRAAAILAAGVLAGVLVQAGGLDRLALPAGVAAALVVGWRLRFRPSRDTRAWRDGAKGERATARLLRRLHRHGWVVFHDVAIPGTPANADHLVIGPPGAILVDSKRYSGQVTQGLDGRVWHNHYPMDHTLRALRLETAAISAALGVRVRPVMCVHHAQIADGGLVAGGVEILPAWRLPSMLRNRRQQLGEAEVAALVTRALLVLRPAG
jgi:Nuclease-related domain